MQWIKDPDCTIYNARTRARAEANLEQKARAEAKTEHH